MVPITNSYSTASHGTVSQTMTFEEYRKLRKAHRWRTRISGIPMGLLMTTSSSVVVGHFYPNMFDATPEEIQPIL